MLMAAAIGAADGRPSTGGELYARLVDAAQRGDTRATQELAAVNAYLTSRGLTADDLGVPPAEPPVAETQVGGSRLAVEDASPWRVTINNRTTFDSSRDVAEYVANRLSVLRDFGERTPDRQVEVVVHPAGRASVSGFLSALVCPCTGVSLIVDVYSPAGWIFASGRDVSGVDLKREAREIEVAVLDQAAQSLDIFPGVSRAQLRAEVRMVRLKTTADSAVTTAGSADVLLVDLVTDIWDAHAGRAAVVEVQGMPDVTEAYRRFVLGDPIGANQIEPVRR
jgi:hypothetical protein